MNDDFGLLLGIAAAVIAAFTLGWLTARRLGAREIARIRDQYEAMMSRHQRRHALSEEARAELTEQIDRIKRREKIRL